jgi:hypothetical protein
MSNEDPPLPTYSGGRSALLGSFRGERNPQLRPVKLQVSVQSNRFGPTFWAMLAAAVLGGGALGLRLGAGAGATPEVAAAPQVEAAPQLAQQEALEAEVARLLHEVRGLRAQVEQIRHVSETQRVADRLKVLEAAHDASLAAQSEPKDAAAPVVSKLEEIDARIARLEHPNVDMTATGSIKPQPGKGRSAH